MNPMPGALTAVRVILFIWAGLAGLVYLLAMVGLGALSEAQLQSEVGMGAIYFFLLLGIALLVFELYVAATMGRGGKRTQTLVRAVVVIGFVGMGINLLMGSNIVLGLVLNVVILILNEGQSAKRWYEETEAPAPYRQGHY